MRIDPRSLIPYGISIAAVAIAIVLRYVFAFVLGYHLPFSTMIGAIAIAVAVGGLYPALLVTAIGYLAGRWLFIEPTGSLAFRGPSDWVLLAGYLFASACVIFFGLLMRRAMRHAHALAAELATRNRQKDELLATIAHELRGPLAPIRSAVEIMRIRETAPQDLRYAREIIERQLGHLARLIDDLVDAGRMGHSQLELRPTRVALNDVIAAAVEPVRPIFHGRHQPLTLHLPPEPLMLEADPIRLEQVFINLLTNASKFSPARCAVELTAVESGGCAEVRIVDGGAGITPEALPHVFELFYRGERGTGGLGIGLALVRQLVQLHGGSVTAHSEGPGRGSVFVVRLPLAAGGSAPPGGTVPAGLEARPREFVTSAEVTRLP